MTAKATIDDFLAQRTLAVAGVSRKRMKFGAMAFRALKKKGYRVMPVNPKAETIDGERCYASLGELPEPVGGVLVILPPPETEKVVRDAAAAGIKRVWLQQGSKSEAAIQFCQENGIAAVHGPCILMFAEPVGLLHRCHRFVWRVIGKLPPQ